METWSSEDAMVNLSTEGFNDGERPSKIRRVVPPRASPRKANNRKRKLCWPVDLVPKSLLGARVLTYGYDTHIRHLVAGRVSETTLHSYASDFLAVLESKHRNNPTRPVVFVAHNLGGLLVKETLRQSRGHVQRDFRTVFESTIGMTFFGTPHEGADPRRMIRRIVTGLAKSLGFRVNDKIVDALALSAEHQLQLRDEFNRMIDDRGWTIYSFQEEYSFPGLSGQKVLQAASPAPSLRWLTCF